MNEWFFDDIQNILRVGLSCLVFYVVTLFISRWAGLRSFTTISGFDFLITLAMGALLATTITSAEVSIVEGMVAMSSLYIFQMIIAWARQQWDFVKRWTDNRPVQLMTDGKVIHDNLKYVRITEDELKSKLRKEGVGSYQQIKAVVLESSGDISVIQNPHTKAVFDPAMLDGVMQTSDK